MVISNFAFLPYSFDLLIAAAVIVGCGAVIGGMVAVYRQLADGAALDKRLAAGNLCFLATGLLVWAIVELPHGIHSTDGWYAGIIGAVLLVGVVLAIVFLSKGDQSSSMYKLLVKSLAIVTGISLALIVLAIVAKIIDTVRGV